MHYKKHAQRQRRKNPRWAEYAWMRANYPTKDQRPRTQKSYDSGVDQFIARATWLGKVMAESLDAAFGKLLKDRLERESLAPHLIKGPEP